MDGAGMDMVTAFMVGAASMVGALHMAVMQAADLLAQPRAPASVARLPAPALVEQLRAQDLAVGQLLALALAAAQHRTADLAAGEAHTPDSRAADSMAAVVAMAAADAVSPL